MEGAWTSNLGLYIPLTRVLDRYMLCKKRKSVYKYDRTHQQESKLQHRKRLYT
jgi:hypothetical protein